MLKKILLASAVLVSTVGVAMANPAPYVGASVGITTNTSNKNSNNSSYGVASYRGVPFNVFAGYGGVVNQNFYLAGELFGTLATANINNGNSVKTTYGYGASIIPGVMLTDHTLAYLRGGVVRANFSQANQMRTGAQLGLGMQTGLTQNVDLRTEYDFVAYRSTKVKGTSTSIAPRADQFSIGLVYKFD